MSQIIHKEKTAHQQMPATHFLQEILINIGARHFHNSINHQEHLFHRTHITSYFRPENHFFRGQHSRLFLVRHFVDTCVTRMLIFLSV